MHTSTFTWRDTIARTAASLGQSERENPARWLTWLPRLRTANVERVEAVLFKAYRWRRTITNMRRREAAGRVSYLNEFFASVLASQSVINLNMKALTLFPSVQQLPLSVRF
jgi:hypothetical protein